MAWDKETNDIINGVFEDETPKHLSDKTYYEKERTYEEIVSGFMSGTDILNLPLEPNDYLVENFLWKGSIGFIIGSEKACKSIFTAQKCYAMTCGEPFLGMFDVARPLNILYIQAEGDMGETKERTVSSTGDKGCMWNPDNWTHFYPPALCLDIDGDMDSDGNYPNGTYNDLVERINRHIASGKKKPDVIIVDPMYMAMEGDLIDNKAVRHFGRNLRRLKELYGCAIIVVHHEHRPKTDQYQRKIDEGDNSIFGSSMIKNFASHVIRISIVDEKGKPTIPEKEKEVKYRKIACATQRNGNVLKEAMLKLREDPLMLEVVAPNACSSTNASILQCIKFNKKASAKEVHNITGIKEATVRMGFSRLRKEGKIKRHSNKGKEVLYCLTNSTSEIGE